MAASAGAWYRVGKVNVTNDNQSVVGVDTNWQSDVIAIAIGDIFTLDAKTWYEVTAVNSDASITLDRGFEGSTGTNKSYAILRNTSGTILTRIAGQVSVQFNQKQLFLDELRTWLNSDNASEELTDSHGLKQSLKTPSQMVRDHDNKLAELDAIHPYPYAMRKVEFEARRAANNEKFAASGFVHFGKSFSPQTTYYVNEGLWCKADNTAYTDKMMMGWGVEGQLKGDSKTNFPEINIAGVKFKLLKISNNILNGDTSVIKLPPAEDGTRTYDSETGISVTHSTPAIAFASETDTNKVVTDRVDMWGFEAFLREIHDGDPFVYKNGLIQNLSANIDGVTTVTDNVRPDTYFAWYEGDTTSTGKGVNWQTATEAQRMAIASNPENNIYFDDETGKFYQWCIRGRSFAGAGNGDWESLRPLGTRFLSFDDAKYVECQGHVNQPRANRAFVGNDTTSSAKANLSDNGTVSNSNLDLSVDGQCYFLVCGTVNRLNKGAYHPSHNPQGTAGFEGATSACDYWYSINTPSITNTFDCFDKKATTYVPSGALSRPDLARRPDGRFYNAIYASGQGGVCRDMRYSAWGLTPNDFAEADLRVKSGGFRGRETLEKVEDLVKIQAGSDGVVGYIRLTATPELEVFLGSSADGAAGGRGLWSDKDTESVEIHDVTTGASFYASHYWSQTQGTFNIGISLTGKDTQTPLPTELLSASGNQLVLVKKKKISVSVSGEYTHTEVIGDPANILQCDDLKDGWVGSWNPKIPDGTGDRFPLTRKVTNTSDDICLYSDDLGDSWLSTVSSFNLIESSNSVAHSTIFNTGNIVVYQFRSRAKLTKDSDNSKVYGGEKGIGNVSVEKQHNLADLGYSLLGKILVSEGYSGETMQTLNLLSSPLSTPSVTSVNVGKLPVVGSSITHNSIIMSAPSNNSPAFKALNYNVEENQQGFINYAYTELKYDTDWGDDGKIHIADNQTTRLDDNGNTVLYGTARIVEPLGWIKNDK
ncbi:lambda phage protein of known function [Pseudoalteromonas sp. PS1M3]|uniref:hypothetical protein n=1 Tax=Pseudoalteromonas sp. PS1M3 TaxID=87791 RepID=UPI0019520001|nr:hypothetical protein [Pseudoalteromonas sp. PS1M3]BBW91804.1 lambda phage protein of known function [Pseudoalteromonas sp. PS1M3]